MVDDSEHLRRLRRNQEFANIAAAANFVQQRQLINQVRDLQSELDASRNEERVYRFAMWLQTPDGQAYSEWKTSALELVSEFQRRDRLWRDTWNTEISERISEHHRAAVSADRFTDPPTLVRFQYQWKVPVLVAGIAMLLGALGSFNNDSFWPYLGFSVLLALLVSVFVWITLYRDHDFINGENHVRSLLEKERVGHFGIDPLDGSERIPAWSEGAEHLAEFSRIRQTLVAADTTFPSPTQLPALQFPPLADPTTVALQGHKRLLVTDFGAGQGTAEE